MFRLIVDATLRVDCGVQFELTFGAESDIEAETLDFLHQNVERLRRPRLQTVVTLNERFVDTRAACNIVGLDGEQLLQRVGGTISFQRPDLHLTETLATILCLTTERLLGNK